MFSDKYGLTQAVLEGRKTMTRRIISGNVGVYFSHWSLNNSHHWQLVVSNNGKQTALSRFVKNDVFAIAQAYKDIPWFSEREEYCRNMPEYTAGWTNKMFVAAKYMPHHIKITNIKVERLHNISDEDCLKEGIYKYSNCGLNGYTFDGYSNDERAIRLNSSPRGAFAALIDKVSGKGTWESNPFCFCYTFELID